MLKSGIIVKTISDAFTVKSEEQEIDCKARGKFRNDGMTPLVGDQVLFDEDKKYIMEIKTRKNELQRPQVANVDIALIITSLKSPDLSLNLLDKLLSMIIINQVTPIICLTKEDLVEKKELKQIKKIMKYYKKIGFTVLYNTEIFKIKKVLKNKIVVLAGQTGAGKSSLLNRLKPELDLKTAPISKALGRGKHTTRHSELFEISNMWFLDTPGFSALDLSCYSEEEIRQSFKEFTKYKCLYDDCNHIKTEGCNIISEVKKEHILPSRYENYCSFIRPR